MYQNIGKTSIILAKEGEYLKEEFYELIKKKNFIFNLIQDNELDGIWFWDLENPKNVWCNSKFWNTVGYHQESHSNCLPIWSNILTKKDYKFFRKQLHNPTKDSDFIYDHIVSYIHLNKSLIYRCVKLVFIMDEKTNLPIRLLGINTYGNHKTLDNRSKSEPAHPTKLYTEVIKYTKIGFWEWNMDTSKVQIDENWAQILGYSLTELEPYSINTLQEYIHPEDLQKSNRLLEEHFENKSLIYECEMRVKHKNGNWIRILDRGKKIDRNHRDISNSIIGSRQQILNNQSELDQHKLFIEQSPSAIAMFDNQMRYISYSRKWITDYEIKIDNITGMSHYDVFPEIEERWVKDHKKCLRGNVLKCEEDRFERVDGSVQWLSWELHPWYTDDLEIGGIIMLTADITKTKEAEIRLKLSERKFRENFKNAAIGMAILDLDGKWLEVNKSLCKMLGYSVKELEKLTFQDITHPDDLEVDLGFVDELLKGKRSFCHIEKRYFHKSGKVVHIILSVSLMRDESKKPLYFMAQITNISPRILAENKLHKTLSKLEGILDASTQVSIIGTNKNGLITTFNKGAENLLGYSRQEIIGKKTPLFVHIQSEVDDRSKELSTLFNKRIEGFEVFTTLPKNQKYDTKEWTYVKKDGTRFPVQLTITAIKNNNKIVGYLGVAADISQIKNVEKEIKSLLKVANGQNKRLKNFAHIVSHNLKSHSSNFSMLLDLYLEEKPDEAQNEIMQLFQSASDNLNDTIQHLNEVVLINTSVDENLKDLNLNNIIERVINGVGIMANSAKVKIINKVDVSISVKGILAYLESIVLNFITNSIKYRSLDRSSFVLLNTHEEDNYIVLTIEDNGLGIDLKKHHAKLFGMYKTFHHNKDARGIGLFITKNQVEAIGGKIEVESEVNQGTIFKIFMKK
ncbi:PAS domain S-box protein [Aquimarina algicola]|uniref:histidine kinase n=1 Tax=Aquimarina algicola TaxID=2589995 RepID=A0A504J225_9FLAO|nr:PAS domain S-box protein [Aquimarina algicola]TPN84474.1 PAS domain S-box protein [Aquimarina algicola]